MNNTFEHAHSNPSSNTIFIFWTHTQSEMHVRNSNSGNWTPNHFVPLLLPSDDDAFQINPSEQEPVYLATTPTKSTAKNNTVTQVRIPQFSPEYDERQPVHSASTTPRTKRRQYTTESNTNAETANLDNQPMLVRQSMAVGRAEAALEKVQQQRILARERSAARRASLTSEQVEQQRTLARERSAARRASSTSEQVEQQRTHARERSAASRAAFTPEELDHRRALVREKTATWRATLTSEQVEHQRALAVERSAASRAAFTPEELDHRRTLVHEKTAAWRATFTSEQVEQQRTHARERSAASRAAFTPEELDQRQALVREKTAAWRATLTSQEIEHQRALAVERSMHKRAVVSPKEAENQRILARQRSAIQRAKLTQNQVEEQRVLARERSRLQKANKKKQTMTTKILEEAQVEWPKPADMECKISCLKKFIQQMSMSCLAEGTCGICNIRCYKRDMRRVPLNKIPALELLKVHDDFCSIIPDIQQKKNLHSVEKHNMDDDLHLPIVQDGREADMDMQHSMNQSSFTYINDVVFYKRGLHYSLDRKKCSLIQCDICIECWSSLTKEKIPKFSVANKVWMGDIPKELQGLTIPEQRLIAIYRHNSCIVKLHSSFHSTATAQSAIKGNCISFPQNVVNIAATLPLELDEICDSLKIIFVGCRIPERNQLKTVLTVRKKKVSEALRWLRQNNPLYRNIIINQSVIDKLPDDDVPECLWATMQVSTNIEAAENERASYVPDPCVNAFESNSTATVPLVPSAVLDVNGTNISSDDVAEHLLERLNMQVVDETLNTGLDKQAQENIVYMIPRGDKPANEYSNPNLLLGVFPTLFPYGCGALEDFSRPVKIDLREHLRYLLSFGDRRFEEHYSFIFVVFNILQRRTACFHAHLMTTRPEFQKSAQLLESLTSADIATALMNISKGVHSHVVDQRISTLMKHIKAVGGHVMGSAHSRSTLRTKIHSLCFYIGLPSIFLTINLADIHSPVALYFAGVNLDLDKILPEALGTSYDRAKIVATHPVATAKFFNCLIKNILKYLILGGVLGPTKAYFGTVENQGRGSLHIHLLIWLNHEFTPAHLKEQIQNEDFREKLLKYLEDIVKEDLDQFRDEDEDGTSAASDNRPSFQETEAVVKEVMPACLPTPNPAHDDFQQIFRKDVIRLVETSNIHRHSATCYKYSKAKSDDKKTCRMRMPRALVEKSNIDVSTGQITMRRSHPWINNFNEWLISACRSNMDIKFIWTGNDAKALVYYITDYVTKSSLAFYDMFALAQQGIKSIEQHGSTNGFDNAVEKSRKLVLRCYNMIASHQEISGVQVASYLMNYGDHYTTHTFRNLFLISIESYLQKELVKSRVNKKHIEEEETDVMPNPFDENQEGDIKEDEEQFLLEPAHTTNGNRYVMVNTRLDYQHRSKDLNELCLYDFVSHFHKKIIDKSDRRLLNNMNGCEGERLCTKGTKMNERHTFASAHPQSSSHIIIKHTTPVVPVLLGPQIPRREREETSERYSRAILTLFVPWRSVQDLCELHQTWSQALEVRKLSISDNAVKTIENIQILHECKNDRDEHLHQIIAEAQDNTKNDSILIPNYYEGDENNLEDDSEELLQMLSLFHLDYKNTWNTNSYRFEDDFNTFTVTHSHHAAMMKEWKHDIEIRKDQARNFLISGEYTLEVREDNMQVEVITSEIPTSPFKAPTVVVPPVTSTIAVSFPTKLDIIKKFTLNDEQKFAFMIIASHLDGDNQVHPGIIDNQLLMCVPGCGGTGKSQLIRTITDYFQVTNRSKMLRKLAPTSIAAAEIDGLTIHSFLGES
ncbi:unnamed protein product, partial [Adineta steineri]